MIRAVVFDIGDVLVNGSPVVDEICEEFGLKKEEMYDYFLETIIKHEHGEIDEREFWSLFTKHFNITKPVPEPSPLIKRYQEEIKKNEEVFRIVEELKNRGFALAILSNTLPLHAEHLEKIGVFEYFPEAILSYEVKLRKPDKEIYKTTLQKLNVLPEEAIFIDNDIYNVKAAEEVGIHGILFKNAEQLQDSLKKLGVLL